MISYTQLSNTELLEKAKYQSQLTFEAQYRLKEEILKRDISLASGQMDFLTETLDVSFEKIKNYKYLSSIGLKLNETGNNDFVIRRSFGGLIMDFLAIVFGMLIVVGSVFMVVSTYLKSGTPEGISAFDLGMAGLFFVLVIVGIQLFFRGLNRLIDHLGFRFEKRGEEFVFRQRKHIRLTKDIFRREDIEINSSANSIELSANGQSIIKVQNPNIKQRFTLKAILERLKENES